MKTTIEVFCTITLLITQSLALAAEGKATPNDLREKIRLEGVKKAKELGYEPAIVARSEEGTIIFLQGSQFTMLNNQPQLTDGNLVVNAGEKEENVFGTKLAQGEYGVVKDGKCVKQPGTLGGAKAPIRGDRVPAVVASRSLTVEDAYAIIEKGEAAKQTGKAVRWEVGPGEKQHFVRLGEVGGKFDYIHDFLVQTKSGRYFAVEATQSQADDFNTAWKSGFVEGVFDGTRDLEKRTVPCIKFVKGRGADSDTTKSIPKDVPQAAFDKLPADWPKASGELQGIMEVRVRNPNDFKVRVGLRSGGKGRDFVVSANAVESVRVPNGRYDIYFHYSSDPDGLYQGDSFTLKDNGVEIQIVKVVNGNYGIRKVK